MWGGSANRHTPPDAVDVVFRLVWLMLVLWRS